MGPEDENIAYQPMRPGMTTGMGGRNRVILIDSPGGFSYLSPMYGEDGPGVTSGAP